MSEIFLHQEDLPESVLAVIYSDVCDKSIAIDTETTGLNPFRDRLCLIQIGIRIKQKDGSIQHENHLVQFSPKSNFLAPNLEKLMDNKEITKIFHFARFDVAFIGRFLNVIPRPLYCTKIVSKLVRTYTEKHGLKELVKELLNIELIKEQQSSDWGAETLTPAQLTYAAGDVLYLHDLKKILDERLVRENRFSIAKACFDFLPFRVHLDLLGMEREDIFNH